VSPRSALIFRAQILGKSPFGRAKFNRRSDILRSFPRRGTSRRPQGAVDGRPFDDVVIKAESADGSPAVLELRAKRTMLLPRSPFS